MENNSEYRITTFCFPDETMATQYGRITFHEWLKREKARIEGKSDLNLEIISNEAGDRLALRYYVCEKSRAFLSACKLNAEIHGIKQRAFPPVSIRHY